MASSPSGSSKRARTISSTSLTVSCLVDGCNSDLSNCRDYHRRHKVCELHSKTPEVTIAGLKQRFCQQCSRFASYHIVSFFFIMLMVSFLLVGGIEHVTFLYFFYDQFVSDFNSLFFLLFRFNRKFYVSILLFYKFYHFKFYFGEFYPHKRDSFSLSRYQIAYKFES